MSWIKDGSPGFERDVLISKFQVCVSIPMVVLEFSPHSYIHYLGLFVCFFCLLGNKYVLGKICIRPDLHLSVHKYCSVLNFLCIGLNLTLNVINISEFLHISGCYMHRTFMFLAHKQFFLAIDLHYSVCIWQISLNWMHSLAASWCKRSLSLLIAHFIACGQVHAVPLLLFPWLWNLSGASQTFTIDLL